MLIIQIYVSCRVKVLETKQNLITGSPKPLHSAPLFIFDTFYLFFHFLQIEES